MRLRSQSRHLVSRGRAGTCNGAAGRLGSASCVASASRQNRHGVPPGGAARKRQPTRHILRFSIVGFSVDVQFGNEQRGIQSATALKAVLTEAAGHQALVFLAGDGGTLVVGVGHSTHAVLLYNPKAGGPPLHGVGDSTAGSSAELQPPLTFDGRSFFDRCALPAQQARRAAQFFFESGGGLLDSIVWEPEPTVMTS